MSVRRSVDRRPKTAADAAIRLSRQSLESIKRPPDVVSRSDLISWGWDPDDFTKRDPTTGWTACHDAALRGRLDIIAYIQEHGGEETLMFRDLWGNTPIGERLRGPSPPHVEPHHRATASASPPRRPAPCHLATSPPRHRATSSPHHLAASKQTRRHGVGMIKIHYSSCSPQRWVAGYVKNFTTCL